MGLRPVDEPFTASERSLGPPMAYSAFRSGASAHPWPTPAFRNGIWALHPLKFRCRQENRAAPMAETPCRQGKLVAFPAHLGCRQGKLLALPVFFRCPQGMRIAEAMNSLGAAKSECPGPQRGTEQTRGCPGSITRIPLRRLGLALVALCYSRSPRAITPKDVPILAAAWRAEDRGNRWPFGASRGAETRAHVSQ